MPQHFTTPEFWQCYNSLPISVRALAEKNYELLKSDATHPSLRLKKVGQAWSVRIGDHYCAVAVEREDGLLWTWIGTHADYDALLRQR